MAPGSAWSNEHDVHFDSILQQKLCKKGPQYHGIQTAYKLEGISPYLHHSGNNNQVYRYREYRHRINVLDFDQFTPREQDTAGPEITDKEIEQHTWCCEIPAISGQTC